MCASSPRTALSPTLLPTPLAHGVPPPGPSVSPPWKGSPWPTVGEDSLVSCQSACRPCLTSEGGFCWLCLPLLVVREEAGSSCVCSSQTQQRALLQPLRGLCQREDGEMKRVAAWGSGWAVSAMPFQEPSSFSMDCSTGPCVWAPLRKTHLHSSPGGGCLPTNPGPAVFQRPLRCLSLPHRAPPETLVQQLLSDPQEPFQLQPRPTRCPVSQQEGFSLTPPDGVEMLPWVGSGHSPAACLENVSRGFPSASTLRQSKPALPRASPCWE